MKICVFCGSSMGNKDIFRLEAEGLAEWMSANNHDLVYGGANVGIMKVLADKMLSSGREVIGIMPTHLIEKEVAHFGLSQMIEVKSMAERKQKMLELSDVFMVLPGGFGTLDELSEILTFNQLRISDKPIGIINVDGYFDKLLEFIDHGVGCGYIRAEHRDNLIVDVKPDKLMQKILEYRPLSMGKWIEDITKESDK